MSSGAQLCYRYADPAFAASYAAAVDAVARERRYLAPPKGFPPEQSRDFVEHVVQNRLPQYFALVGDTVAGWCDILPKQYEGMTHVGVLGMGVRAEFRRRGIGRELLARCLAHAQEVCGLEKVELEVFASNRGAIRLYEQTGFCCEGKLLRARKLDGAYDNIVLMAKFLTAADR